MMQLWFAYLAAACLIGTLVLLARRNRKQGWRRSRGFWLDAQAAAALRAVEAPIAGPSLQHLDDLGRLHQAIASHGVAQGAPESPAPVEKPLKSNVLA